jgi:hypothetical protein
MEGINLHEAATGALDNQVITGDGNAQELAELNKALSAGSITGRETTNLTTASGSPLKVESLEANLKNPSVPHAGY